jgi:UDP-N-acetylmuramate dehydrogenase
VTERPGPAPPAGVTPQDRGAVDAARHLEPDEALRLGAEIQRRIGVKTSRGEPLARLTTMRVGGPADLFVEAHNLFELRALVRFARARSIPLFILGRGSNLVVSDRGMAGLVLHNRAAGHRIEGEGLTADSGLAMARAATLAKDAGLSGLEYGLAIPGTIGGAVWANAGAHETDTRSILVEVGLLLADGSEAVRTPETLGLAYRESLLKHAPAGSPEVVTWATFRLAPAEPALVAARLDTIRRWRQAHQPLGLPSAGSFFRNPPEGPAAGALIDGLGLKGLREGGASVSEKHANFIVNDGAGTAADVRRLGERVRERVRRETGVELAYEVAFVGDWSGWEVAP